jgi:hypothetical protein
LVTKEERGVCAQPFGIFQNPKTERKKHSGGRPIPMSIVPVARKGIQEERFEGWVLHTYRPPVLRGLYGA